MARWEVNSHTSHTNKRQNTYELKVKILKFIRKNSRSAINPFELLEQKVSPYWQCSPNLLGPVGPSWTRISRFSYSTDSINYVSIRADRVMGLSVDPHNIMDMHVLSCLRGVKFHTSCASKGHARWEFICNFGITAKSRLPFYGFMRIARIGLTK